MKSKLGWAVIVLSVGAFQMGSARAQYTAPQSQPTYIAEGFSQSEVGKTRLEFFGKFGFAGNASLSGSDGTRSMDIGDFDLDASPGGGIGFSHLIVDYFGIGARFQVARYVADSGGDDGILAFDFALVPRGRFPFSDGRAAMYLAVPLGVSVFTPEEGDADEEIGFNFGLMPGFEFFLTDAFGIFAEVGFQYHSLTQSEGSIDLTLAISELSIVLGGKFAF